MMLFWNRNLLFASRVCIFWVKYAIPTYWFSGMLLSNSPWRCVRWGLTSDLLRQMTWDECARVCWDRRLQYMAIFPPPAIRSFCRGLPIKTWRHCDLCFLQPIFQHVEASCLVDIVYVHSFSTALGIQSPAENGNGTEILCWGGDCTPQSSSDKVIGPLGQNKFSVMLTSTMMAWQSSCLSIGGCRCRSMQIPKQIQSPRLWKPDRGSSKISYPQDSCILYICT